jgi:hypothetical protein
MTRATVGQEGRLSVTGSARTAKGVRTVVVSRAGAAFAADSNGGRLLAVETGSP